MIGWLLWRELNMGRSPHSTPVVLFLFRRPQETQVLLETLERVKPSKLYVVMDAARDGNSNEVLLVDQVKELVDAIPWESDIIKVYATQNLGLRERILTGLDFVFDREPRAIILEDDCIPHETFFGYAEELLEFHQHNLDLGIISGFNPRELKGTSESYHYVFAPYIWGWATWDRVWKEFRSSPQVEQWDEAHTQLVLETFDHPSARRSFSRMMSLASSLNTWDISFDVFLREKRKLNIIPRTNLIRNIGFGGGATHTFFEFFDVPQETGIVEFPLRHPNEKTANSTHEVRHWRNRNLSWVTFPLSHPIETLRRLVSYVNSRPGSGIKK
jgi:hypothetical protein